MKEKGPVITYELTAQCLFATSAPLKASSPCAPPAILSLGVLYGTGLLLNRTTNVVSK